MEAVEAVVIRCRASAAVGMGHLVRCRVLGAMLRAQGIRVILVGVPLSLRRGEDDACFDHWIEREGAWDSAVEAAFLIDLAATEGARHAILDDYRSDGLHQSLLRDAGLRLLQQYDASIPQRFAAALVVNCSPAEKAHHYRDGLLRPGIRFLHGPDYAILRPDFTRAPPARPRTAIARLLVTFGGGDDRGAVLRVLEDLAGRLPPSVETVVMIGAANPRREEIATWIAARPEAGTIRLAVSPEDVPALLDSCDLMITAGGTSAFEAAYRALPMIVIPIVGNQLKMAGGWQDCGAGIDLGDIASIPPGRIAVEVLDLIADPQQVSALSATAGRCVDGRGAERLLEALLEGG